VTTETLTKDFYTSRQAATILSVSLRTVQLWEKSGILTAWKTVGGHRRIEKTSIVKLLDKRSEQLEANKGDTHSSHESKTGSLNVLVVEDEAVQLELYRIMFARWDFSQNVKFVSDGYKALIEIGQNKPDIIFTDIDMPDFDGVKMIRSITDMYGENEVEIVAISALSQIDIDAKGGLPGYVRFLPKPIPFDAVKSILELSIGKYSIAS